MKELRTLMNAVTVLTKATTSRPAHHHANIVQLLCAVHILYRKVANGSRDVNLKLTRIKLMPVCYKTKHLVLEDLLTLVFPQFGNVSHDKITFHFS